MRIASVNIGGVIARKNARGTQGETGIGKEPIKGSVQVETRGLVGDYSAYRSRELGDTAVHAFCAESYQMLSSQSGSVFPIPCFGENLTIEGYPESEARVGDELKIGSVILHVNQPVVRCSWPSAVAGEPRLLKWMLRFHITGFYLDVRQPGVLKVDDEIKLIDRGADADLTIGNLNRILADGKKDQILIEKVLSSQSLAERWKKILREEGR